MHRKVLTTGVHVTEWRVPYDLVSSVGRLTYLIDVSEVRKCVVDPGEYLTAVCGQLLRLLASSPSLIPSCGR